MVGDIIQAVIGTRFGDQIGLNVRHYVSVNTTGGGISSLVLLANALASRFSAIYPSLISAAAEFRGVIVQKVRPLPAGMPFLSTSAAVPGNNPTDPLPGQVAGLISLRTAFSGRRFRGRAYIPFPAEEHNDSDSTPTGFYLTNLTTLAQAMVNPIGITDGGATESYVPAVYHKEDGTATFITSAVVNDGWATQRRRGVFGRPNVLLSGEVPVIPA